MKKWNNTLTKQELIDLYNTKMAVEVMKPFRIVYDKVCELATQDEKYLTLKWKLWNSYTELVTKRPKMRDRKAEIEYKVTRLIQMSIPALRELRRKLNV